ncbi:glutathione transferase [Pseudomonas syringae]|nr:glutathione transferase [Pseudomonas syringae]
MSNAPLRLYVDDRFTSPYALSAFVVLREKGLDFDLLPVNLQQAEHRHEDYAALSLTRRVPTLVHGNFALSESSAITEYLDEAFPDIRVYPQDPKQRARARQVQAWLRSDLLAIRAERSTLVVFYGQKVEAPLSVDGQLAADTLIAAAQHLLQDGREHVCGQWSISDVDLALMLNRLILNGDPVPQGLVDYATRQCQRPSVQAWFRLQRPAL